MIAKEMCRRIIQSIRASSNDIRCDSEIWDNLKTEAKVFELEIGTQTFRVEVIEVES